MARRVSSRMSDMREDGFSWQVNRDATGGRDLPGQWKVGEAHATTLVSIKSGPKAPAEAYTAIPYRGNW